MTDPVQSEQNSQSREDAEQIGVVPIYNLQLHDVILEQMSVTRSEEPLQMPDAPEASINWNVGFGELSGAFGKVAKLTLDYQFPSGEIAAYSLHVELVGLFIGQSPPVAGEVGDEVSADMVASASDSSEQAQPLNEYSVMVLLWPYMREVIQDLQLRMRVPVILLPTLDVANIQSIQKSTPQE